MCIIFLWWFSGHMHSILWFIPWLFQTLSYGRLFAYAVPHLWLFHVWRNGRSVLKLYDDNRITLLNQFKARVLTVDISQAKRLSCKNNIYVTFTVKLCIILDIKIFQNNLFPPPLKVPHNWLFLFKQNATVNYHDSQWCNNEHNNLDSNFSFLKPI